MEAGPARGRAAVAPFRPTVWRQVDRAARSRTWILTVILLETGPFASQHGDSTKGATMLRRHLLTSATAFAVWPRPGRSQGSGRMVRMGWLTAQRAPSLASFLPSLIAGLSEYGYVEGRNLAIEYRFGDDDLTRVPALAAELARVPVDVLLVQGAAVPVATKLGLPVPIVFVTSGDPVVAGLADSLARPRANMTGVTFMAAEMNGKRLQFLREILPGLRRVAVIANPDHPGVELEKASFAAMGAQLKVDVTYLPTRSSDELTAALARIDADPPEAISVFADGFAIQNRQRIIEFATTRRLPVISGWAIFAQSGALFTYGPQLADSYRRMAYYVDRIVKGAKPDTLPIEQPTRYELVINLKSARTLGITIPPTVFGGADAVME